MKGGGISKRSQRGRGNFFKALKSYLMADSYMYGALLYPNKNYRASSDAPAPTTTLAAKGTFWQTKRTSVTLSSVNVHKSLKPSAASSQSKKAQNPVCYSEHDASFRNVPVESIEKVKHVIEDSAPPSTIDHINQIGKPVTIKAS